MIYLKDKQEFIDQANASINRLKVLDQVTCSAIAHLKQLPQDKVLDIRILNALAERLQIDTTQPLEVWCGKEKALNGSTAYQISIRSKIDKTVPDRQTGGTYQTPVEICKETFTTKYAKTYNDYSRHTVGDLLAQFGKYGGFDKSIADYRCQLTNINLDYERAEKLAEELNGLRYLLR